MTTLILTFLPEWLLLSFALITALHRWTIVIRFPITVSSRMEQTISAIALTMIALFYLGVTLQWWQFQTAVAISRLLWLWILSVALFNSHRMAIRNTSDGLE